MNAASRPVQTGGTGKRDGSPPKPSGVRGSRRDLWRKSSVMTLGGLTDRSAERDPVRDPDRLDHERDPVNDEGAG